MGLLLATVAVINHERQNEMAKSLIKYIGYRATKTRRKR